MARSARPQSRGSLTTWVTFIVGVPLGVGVLYLIDHGPWQNATIQRYVHHEAEQAVVIFFCCCMTALAAKLWSSLIERYAQTQQMLPSWDGKPIALAEVTKLQQALSLAGEAIRKTYLARRIENLLSFVASRHSVSDLDDQMRTLSDNDAMALDGSYSINRFLIWAMPILGFLGTVLGITEAIVNITPEQMNDNPGAISSGLTKAFDATALALSVTLVAMFINSMLEKFEQNLLERVDEYVDRELAHRFIRTPGEIADAGAAGPALQQMVSLWTASMDKAEQRWMQTAPQQTAALQQAIDASLTRFGQRMIETEKKLLERQNAVLDGLTKLAASFKEATRDQQHALARLTDAIGLSVEMIAKSQTNETQLLRLQESLSQNLALLANSTTFEQAVESLTAAIHLLTTRVNPATGPRLMTTDKNAA